MSKTYVQHGKTLPLTAPAGGVISGSPYMIGAIFGVAQFTAAAGDSFELETTGVHRLPKTTGQVWGEGEVLYFDPATGKLTDTAGALKKVGVAVADAATGDVVGLVKLIPTI